MEIICAKCNGKGYNNYYSESEAWSEWCPSCKGTGRLNKVNDLIIDDIIIDEEMVYITKKEYENLLEYKHMYEDLCT